MIRLAFSVLLLQGATLIGSSPATAEDVRGDCYLEGNHFRCLGHPFKEDRSVKNPVVPPQSNFPNVEEKSLDRTGKPAFTAPTDSLYPEKRPSRAEGQARNREDRYRPLPDDDTGYYYPGTRVPPSSPLYGRPGPGGAFGQPHRR